MVDSCQERNSVMRLSSDHRLNCVMPIKHLDFCVFIDSFHVVEMELGRTLNKFLHVFEATRDLGFKLVEMCSLGYDQKGTYRY